MDWLKQLGRGIDDTVRIAANGITFGLPDYLEGAGAAERTAAARDRLGVFGDAVNAGTMLVGGGGAIKGGIAAVRAAPRAMQHVKAFGVGGVARNTARSRLGLSPVANPVWNGAVAAGRAAKAHPIKTGLGATAIGIGTVGGYQGRQGSTARAAQTPQKQAAKPAQQKAAAAPAAKLTPFEEATAAMARANGGQISLNELSALAGIIDKASPRAPSAKDVAMTEFMALNDEVFAVKMGQAQAAKAAGDIDEATRLQGEAVKERMTGLQSILGTNPVDLQTAAAMSGPGEPE
jgi:hypothetical protein